MRALVLDLETSNDGRLKAFAAMRLWNGGELVRADLRQTQVPEALRELAAFGTGASVLVGHNLISHDRPALMHFAPQSWLLTLPCVDTLVLSPLGFPERPYHKLLKAERLVRDSRPIPLADCRACAEVLHDLVRAFARIQQDKPALIGLIRSVLTWPGLPHSDPGYAQLLAPARDSPQEALGALLPSLKAFACVQALETLAPAPEDWLPLAYALVWMQVPPGSTLPAWVRLRFPRTQALIRTLREIPCNDPRCAWCREQHSPEGWLQRIFGYEQFRETPTAPDGSSLQRAIVSAGMSDQPLYAILPTGTGKSLCFQIPAIARHRRSGVLTVVVSPLQSLMKDQVGALDERDPHACTINGSLTMPERSRAIEEVQSGFTSILYLSPEQLRSPGVRRALVARQIGAWVIDEAHCLSDWGHDFRTDYLYLPRFARELAEKQGMPIPPIQCFTGTSQQAVTSSIVNLFEEELGQRLLVFDGGSERDNLSFAVERRLDADKLPRLLELLEEHLQGPNDAAIVFCSTQTRTEDTAKWLSANGQQTEAYHAGLDPQKRREIQDKFLNNEFQIIAATSAFGMGVDKANVRLVVHRDIPGSLEAYLQQAGRAGRDRKPAHCVLLFESADVDQQFSLAARSQLTLRDLSALWRGIQRVPQRTERNESGETELRIVTRGELARLESVSELFPPNDPGTDTRITAALSWLERAGLFKRDENLTRVFQGRPTLPTLDEARTKIRALKLPESKARAWELVLGRLYEAEADEGLSADDMAELAGKLESERQGPLEAGVRLLDLLHQMVEARLLTAGTMLTAFVSYGVEHGSQEALDRLLDLQRRLLDLLVEQEPDADLGSWLPASPRLLAEQLSDSESAVRPKIVAQLLYALKRDGLGLSEQSQSADLRNVGHELLAVKLRRSWVEIRALQKLRAITARCVLGQLLGVAQQNRERGKNLLVQFLVEDLIKVLDAELLLRGQIRSAPALVDQTLLFLHDCRVITLQSGLAVFRQAMALRRDRGGSSRLLKDHVTPLHKHEQERTVQIHVVHEYARLGAEHIDQARSLSKEWFSVPRETFLKHWFPRRKDMLTRPTSQDSYEQIVGVLDPQQREVVTENPNSNLLVLAGPGSGKTRVLVHRVAWLLRIKRVRPEGILVVCYTRANAIELRRRLNDLAKKDAHRVTVTTLHGLALRLTGRTPQPAQNTPDFDGLLADATAILRRERIPPDTDADEVRDLVLRGATHLLVDEYQDMEERQVKLLEAIGGLREQDEDQKLHLLAVGDDDQSIFMWRGASLSWVARFADDWKATRYTLTRCYRCTPPILAAASAMIEPVPNRLKADKHLEPVKQASGPNSPPVLRLRAPAGAAGDEVLRWVNRLRDHPDFDWHQLAILCRTRDGLSCARQALEGAGLPCRWPLTREEGIPLFRIREFVAVLNALADQRQQVLSLEAAGELVKRFAPQSSPWRELLNRWLLDLSLSFGPRGGLGLWLERSLWEALATEREDRSLGHGIHLGTLHGAKGLEWDHVLLLDDGRSHDEEVEARRLHYVGMTRARQSLTLLLRQERPQPQLAALPAGLVVDELHKGDPTTWRTPTVHYGLMGLMDLWIDWLGRQSPDSPSHACLSGLPLGASLDLLERGETLVLMGPGGVPLSRVAKGRVKLWRERLEKNLRLNLVAVVWQDQDHCALEYRELLRCARWQVPVCEARWST